MVRLAILALLVGAVASVYLGYDRSQVWLRYRLTLEVQTPEGVRTGSSVLQNTLCGRSIISLPGTSEERVASARRRQSTWAVADIFLRCEQTLSMNVTT